jgi:tRNA 2-thiouridine synthesizing protein A
MTGLGIPRVLDVRGLLCVQVLLRLRPVVEALPPGALVDVMTDDPAAPLDLPAWCHLTGHHYLGPVDSGMVSAHRIAVTADARPVDHMRPWAARAGMEMVGLPPLRPVHRP